jgi:hypothetical protein
MSDVGWLCSGASVQHRHDGSAQSGALQDWEPLPAERPSIPPSRRVRCADLLGSVASGLAFHRVRLTWLTRFLLLATSWSFLYLFRYHIPAALPGLSRHIILLF